MYVCMFTYLPVPTYMNVHSHKYVCVCMNVQVCVCVRVCNTAQELPAVGQETT